MVWLDTQASCFKVKTRKIGTTGYCMGGPMVVRTAASVPERVGAAATFHGGGLGNRSGKQPGDLLVPQMKAQSLHCVAQNDDQNDMNAKVLLKEAFDKAKLSTEIEVYPAMHGWCAIDSEQYNMEQAERAHRAIARSVRGRHSCVTERRYFDVATRL